MKWVNLFGTWDGNYLCRFHRWRYTEGRWPYRHYVCLRCGEMCAPAVVGPGFAKEPERPAP